ncbi:type IV toxin-antitoxin system AbiEi family antitoxin domain-containing protein [Tunicatimonas pelagia]|uniref:type IV toxin-antitoxin system AbiEi family antitoxin domain-containing protein n=1 Tax=Tunicatimonas pelagia TaxID=931531 RepID=UPI0026668F1B|nr:hypothetical protein [Tunicatimonas pelagia]WKN44898.1 hypothetical protein P0M28_07975 [Tunicatimonas pelagia]
MKYITFQQQFQHWPLFSTQDIKKAFPDFDFRRLVEWQQKGYLQKIVNRWYRFSDPQNTLDESYRWYVANRIYQPSYVSLESALSYYGLIPEAVYRITSVSSLKTQHYETPVDTFDYRHLKPSLLFGYRLLSWQEFRIRMAEPEKMILDFLYLRSELREPDDFTALRINQAALAELIDPEKLHRYLLLFGQKKLAERVETFLDLLYHAEPS